MTATEPLDTDMNQTTGERDGRRWWPWIVGALTIAAMVVVAVAVTSSSRTAAEVDGRELSTATVQRRNLVVTETVSGTFGYGEAQAITFRTSTDGVTTVLSGLSGVLPSPPN